jgi:hypothetical protein
VQSDVEPLALIVTVGDCVTVNEIAPELTVHEPQVTATLYVYVPGASPVGTE